MVDIQQRSARRLRNLRRVLCCSMVLMIVSINVHAQVATDAVVLGTVSDASGGVVSGASVTFVHAGTGRSIHVISNEHGEFRTPPLAIGDYSLTVQAPGFSEFHEKGLTLNLGDVRQIEVMLSVGAVSQTIEVASAAPLLQTSDSTVGTVITNKQIDQLPLNGRDYLQLAALSAGTVPAINGGVGISVGGQAGAQVSYLLDGLDNNNQQISTSHSNQKEIIKPSVDAIQEFKVVTNGYSAELGRSSSGVVTVSLKSGTNEFHGAGYEFFRNQALDAKNYFALSNPPYKRNQFGADVGGPIVHNKLFFFGDFEIGRIRQTTTVVSTLPTLNQRAGLFSAPIIDPSSKTAFRNNQIPEGRIDPVALTALSYLPLPQTPAVTNNYVYASPLNQDPYRWDFRVDAALSDRQNLYIRYSSQTQDAAVSAPLPPDAQGNYYSGSGAQHTDSKSFVLVQNAVWSPTLVSSVRAGWNSLFWTNTYPNQNLTSIGIPGVGTANPGFSQLAITGDQTFGITNVPNTDGSQDRQLSGDITWTRGAHTIKFGVQAYWLQTNFLSSQRSSGIFNFNGQFTGDPFADFLLGDASSASLSKWAYLRFRTPYTHFYVQDDWKVNRRLTLNIGLRYELSPPAVEKQNKIVNFDMDTNPASPQLIAAGSEGDGRASRALQDVNHHQFAPRFGFAYALPDNRTVLRGGYGVFYSNLITLGGMQSMEINPPNHVRIGLTTDPTKPSIFLDQGFASDALSVSNAKNVELVSYDRRAVTPLAQQWNLNIQRQLPGNTLLEIGYYGNKLDHMWRQIDGNPAPPGPGNINSRRQFHAALVPGTSSLVTLSDVVRIQKDGYSRYNALQAKIEKRYSRGLALIASYAYSKTIALGDTAGVQNPLNWASDRAVSSQDMTHHIVGSAVYDLPFGHGKRYGANWGSWLNAALGGWSLGPIVTLDSGIPLNLTVPSNPSNSGQTDRPNVVGDWHLPDPSVEEWFNTAAFTKNAVYGYGNAGRNVLRGPGLFNVDLGAHKSFRISERVSAQLRLESFNLTNTPALGPPNTQVGTPGFGQISSAGTPRDNQAGLKIVF